MKPSDNQDGDWYGIENEIIETVDDIRNDDHFISVLLHAFDTALPDVFENLAGCFARFKTTPKFKEIQGIFVSL